MNVKSEKEQKNVRKLSIVVVAILAIVVVSLLLFRTFTNQMVNNITKEISSRYSAELNAQMSAHISSTLDYYFSEMNTEYYALSLMDNFDEEKLRSFITDAETTNDISYIAFADTNGNIYEADGSYLGTMRVPMLGKLLNGAEHIVSDNVTIGNENYIMFGSSFEDPVQMGDKTISIVLLGMDNNDLAEHVALQSDYSGGFSSIIHTDGSYVIKNQAETCDGLNVFSILKKSYDISDEDYAALKEAISEDGTYLYNAKSNDTGESIYLYFAPIDGTEWYIVNTIPGSFIEDNVVNLTRSLEVAYFALMAVLILIALIVLHIQMSSSRKLRRSHDELEKALDLAEQASNAKTSFLFNMSHDIRTPMNAILGYTDIGLRHINDKEITKDSYNKIKTAGGHLLNLINDILEMSRIESGKMTINEKPIDIREAIADVTTMSKSLATAKSMDYETVIGDIKNPYIYADELHINEVIINIVSNAVKYTPEEGKVRYTINQISDVVDGKVKYRFEITDNGIGMSKEFQEHLFETFSREENTTMSKIEGTGLGLSIVKKIVDLFGGTIEVHSVQGEGSTFIVEIPFRVMDEKAIEEFEAEKNQAQVVIDDDCLNGKLVLLVDDNDFNREVGKFVLNNVGMTVEEASDGKLAVDLIKEKGMDYYDFILMDIQMPVMDGYEATKVLRALPDGDKLKIIALSANAFEEDKKKSIDNGMDAHVAKPIDVKALMETIQSLLN